jgi:2-polyprenyl-3-methyl-5-hydroxy-6-metoxy-1,4-benzoquinol methylase
MTRGGTAMTKGETSVSSYASYTRDTTEPLKSLAHKRRYRQVLDLVAPPLPKDRVLDYGCGDGHLFSFLVDKFDRQNLVGYDPDLKLLAEAEPSVSAGAQLTPDIDSLIENQPSSFSLIYCMEVCEHLTDKSLDELLKNITSLASPRARIIIGVPIETGLSGFLKSIYRAAHGGHPSAGIAQAFRALFNMKIEREVTDVEWHGAHTGFSHIRLREILKHGGFRIVRTSHLPFPALRNILNNEIYFVCERGSKSRIT